MFWLIPVILITLAGLGWFTMEPQINQFTSDMIFITSLSLAVIAVLLVFMLTKKYILQTYSNEYSLIVGLVFGAITWHLAGMLLAMGLLSILILTILCMVTPLGAVLLIILNIYQQMLAQRK